MNRLRHLGLAIAALLFAQAAAAAELLVSTFLDNRPLEGLDVELDGRLIGITDDQGTVTADIGSGRHTLRVLKNEATLADYPFTLGAGQGVEISVGFTDFARPALVRLETYDAADPAAGGAAGTVLGKVRDAQGAPIAGAIARIEERDAQAVTDAGGNFVLEVPRGIYTLSVTHPDYDAARRGALRVVAHVGVAAEITLREPSAGSGAEEEVVVLGTYRPAENTAELEKFSVAITDAISIDELLRFGDSDVAATLKRIVGVSITGDRYAVVRGLDGRYIAATLNGNLMPSTDPFRRDVQLDLFPSDILGGIEIQKSFSADLPGETTGGIIRINTRGLPDAYVQSLSLSLGATSGVTGQDFATYEGGDRDWLGVDDGTRELPGAVRSATNNGLDFSYCQVAGQQNCVSQAEGVALAAMLPNVWNVRSRSAGPDYGFGYTLGDRFEMQGGSAGAYGSFGYARESSARQDAQITDPFRNVQSRYIKDEVTTNLDGYLVAGWQADSGWELLSKTMLLRSTEDSTTAEQGINNEGIAFARTTLEWVERQFLAQQFQGKHFIFGEQQIDWRLGASQSERYSPDRRSYEYLGGTLAFTTVERAYSELTEDGLDLGLDWTIPVDWSGSVHGNIKLGVLGNSRKRDQELIRIGLSRGSNQNVDMSQDMETLLRLQNFQNDAFRLDDKSTDTDSYTAEQTSLAGYIATETNIGERVTLVAGLRQDNYTVDLSMPNAAGTPPVELESEELLPALGVILRPSEAWQLRLGYGATVSRPNITELAPSRFYDENDREFIGCPTCKASTIDNFDARIEYYFSERDSISLAIFAKDIDQPLEVSVADASGSSSNALTFRNSQGAKLTGIELDASTSLLLGADWGMNLGGNLSFISSEIELDEVGRRLERDPERDLQGQSPFLANLQLGFDHFPWGQQFTLLANYFDDRIDRVTRNQPSVYEAGRLTVNFNYEKAFANESKVSFKVKNLLDAKTEYSQDEIVIERYRRGVEFSLGYSYSF